MSFQSETVRVNFGRPMPLFPLESVVLLPHGMTRLHIFEPRYRQMMADVLDGPGQIAMALLRHPDGSMPHAGNPPLRPAVCVGHLAHHQKLPDGRYHIVLSGVCRAEIIDEEPPDGDRLYRVATLRPLGASEPPPEDELTDVRDMLSKLVRSGRFPELEPFGDHLEGEESLPTMPLLETVSLALASNLQSTDFAYGLLAEPSVFERARMVEREYGALEQLFGRALLQRDPDAPRGVSWN
ncbi:MAG: LON peptidase substrate-binding domain-containing protein [Planctomycetota bacterium]